MRIHAPVAAPDEVDALVHAGADALYCGVVETTAGDKQEFHNRRPTPAGNLSSFQELELVTGRARQLRVPVSFVLNEPYYSDEQQRTVIRQAHLALDCGVDALIMSAPLLFEEVSRKKLGVELHVSTTASLFNRAAIEFFSQLGATRIILPRQVSIAEIEMHVKAHPELEFEVIVLGDPCPFDDGQCTFEHNLHLYTNACGFSGGGCHLPYEFAVVRPQRSGELPAEAQERLIYNLRRFTMLSGCGFCSLWDLRSAGVRVLKSCARDDNVLRHHNVRYLHLVRHLLSNEGIDKTQFQSYAREIRARMYYDFLAENLVKRAAAGADDSRLGREVRALVGQSWLLNCDPPSTCYLPDCLVEGSGDRAPNGPHVHQATTSSSQKQR